MKKNKLFLMLLAFFAFGSTAWAQFSGGTGTETDPYLISNVNDWNTLADNVNDGNPYSGLYFQMTADIDVGGKMVGKSNSKSFQGIFDGNGHTLTFNKKIDGKYIAPFHYAKNATFKRLHTAGKVQEKDHIAGFERYGGIAGRICGNCNFISCRSSVKLDLDYHTDKYDEQKVGNHGGFVGEIDFGTAIFINCLYDGALDLRNQGGSGGFVGFIDYDDNLVTATFINCLVAPTSVKLQYCTPCTTYVGGNKHNTSYSLHNCYYTHEIDDREGIDASGWLDPQLLRALGDGWIQAGTGVVPNMLIDYYTFTGTGTEDTPYEIASATDWNHLASNILMGANYSGKHFQLTQNIEVTETVSADGLPVNMLGVNKSLSFRGTFDGNGHTITINYTDNRTGSGNENHYCGPFRIINGATIENLHVAGTIRKEDKKHAGGIVGKAYGQNYIRNCRSSVTIESNTNGDGSHGGFIGDLREGNTELAFCLFDGKMQGPNGAISRTTKWGGFVGWVADDGSAVFKHCLFAPSAILVSKTKGSRTFARRDDGDDVLIANCYYFEALGSSQGKQALSISGNENVSMTPYSTYSPNVNNVSGITIYRKSFYEVNPGLEYGGMYYAGNGDEVLLNLSQNGATPDGAQANSFIATPGSLSGTSSPYTLNMPNTNTTISLATTDWAPGHLGVYSDPYYIYTAEQWDLLAERVNSGNTNGYVNKYFKLMADISVSTMVGSGRSNENKSFRGTFDGNGHTLTFTYTDNSSSDYCAPFRYINGATIEYLHVAGTIVKSNGKKAGGLVGLAEGDNTITNCRSSVDIQFNKNGDVSSGGFIGELRYGGTTTFTNCLFDGKLQGTNAYKWGGFIGWVADTDGTCTANFNNCLFNPELVSIDVNDSDDNSENFARHDGDVNITNSYRKYTIKGTQGTEVPSSWSNEQLRTALGEAWEVKNNQVVPIMTLYLFSGAGNSASSPYLITSVEDWNGLVGNVYLGENYTYTYFQLTDDISVTRMVGTTNNAFKGHFDGDGNTLTFTANTSADYTAPFRYVDGATIQDLVVDGSITTSAQFAAGFIGRAGSINSSTSGSISITNCRSSITINSSVNGDGTHGGFIANIYSGTNNKITGCVFNGSLLGSNTESCGGFVGWTRTEYNYASLTITNSLFAPASLTVSNTGSCTFSRHSGMANYPSPTILSSYYTQALGATNGQGRQAYSITAGEYVTMEIVGDSTEYEVSGLTLYPVGIEFNDVLYAGNGDNVSLSLSSEISEGFTFYGYGASNGTLTGSDNPYTLTMPNDNVTVYASHSIEWPGTGTEEDPYRIYQSAQLDLLASRTVNNGVDFNGQYFLLMADLVYDYSNLGEHESNFTPIGHYKRHDNANNEDYYRPFKGHFDGNGYTISGIRVYSGGATLNDDSKGLFGYIEGNGTNTGVVKNLTLTDAVITGRQYCGGIVGCISGGTVDNCHVTSSVFIHGVATGSHYHGGIVGGNNTPEGGCPTVKNCTSSATLTNNDSYYYYGGIVGYNKGQAVITDNLVIGATVPATTYRGAIAGYFHSGTLERNYYVGCTVAGVANAIGVGCYMKENAIPNVNSGLQDVTANDGAVTGYLLTLDENITSDALSITVPAHGETEEVTYNVAASGNIITLGYEPSNGVVTYYVNNEALQGNTFTMPAEDVTVTADLLGISKFISGYSENTNGWNLIASPVGTVNIEDVTNMLSNTHDLYRFNQAAEREWENYKAIENEQPLHSDFTTLESGRGYLYANSNDVTLLFPGTPYNGTGEVTLDYTDNNSNEDMRGWNLVGNPFAETAYIDRPFYVMNSEGNEIIAAEDANRSSIAPMEGIFVKATENGETLTFTTEAPANNGGAKLSLNLSHANRGGVSALRQNQGSMTAVIDRAIVCIGEGHQLPKFQIRGNSTKLYIPQDNVDYAVVNADAQGEMPLNFKAHADGTYTLTVNPEGVEMAYLHLIDNMTGADVDLLATNGGDACVSTYTFTAKTTDYASRFRLVFACGDDNGNNGGDNDNFAFFSNGNIIVNGTGTLQVIDILGREVAQKELSTFNSQLSTLNYAPGIYVLRLINGKDVKTQKVVIE